MQQEEFNAPEFAEKMKVELAEYSRLKLEVLKAEVVEKIAVMFGKLITGLVLLLGIFFTILFTSLVVGFYISEQLNSTVKGFSVVALFYVLLLLLVLLFKRKFIQNPIANTIVSVAYNDQEDV